MRSLPLNTQKSLFFSSSFKTRTFFPSKPKSLGRCDASFRSAEFDSMIQDCISRMIIQFLRCRPALLLSRQVVRTLLVPITLPRSRSLQYRVSVLCSYRLFPSVCSCRIPFVVNAASTGPKNSSSWVCIADTDSADLSQDVRPSAPLVPCPFLKHFRARSAFSAKSPSVALNPRASEHEGDAESPVPCWQRFPI